MNNLKHVYEFCRKKDNKIPPFPCDYYKDSDISSIKQLILIH
jgi:hypothetical protein